MADYGYLDVLGVPFKTIGGVPSQRLYPLDNRTLVGELPLFDHEFNWYLHNRDKAMSVSKEQAIVLALNLDERFERICMDLGDEPDAVRSYGVYLVLRSDMDRFMIPFFAYNDDFAVDYLFKHKSHPLSVYRLFSVCDFSLIGKDNPVEERPLREIALTEEAYKEFL